MTDLRNIIKALSQNQKFHISIAPTSDIFGRGLTRIEFFYQIHGHEFCDCAKSTDRGLKLCFACKKLSLKKVMETKKPQLGICPYGIYDVIYPIVIDDMVKGVIYISNFFKDDEETKKHIERACRLTGVDKEELFSLLSTCDRRKDFTEIFTLAEIINDYALALSLQDSSKSSDMHWLVSSIKEHIDLHYHLPLSLNRLAESSFFNAKYIGSLFKNQVGQSFHSYLNAIRLRHAEEQLLHTKDTVLEIALNCGYENVTYFNRIFMQKHGMTPTQFRKKHKNEPEEN